MKVYVNTFFSKLLIGINSGRECILQSEGYSTGGSDKCRHIDKSVTIQKFLIRGRDVGAVFYEQHLEY